MTTTFTKLKEKLKNFRKLENCDDDEKPDETLPLVMDYLPPVLLEEARTKLRETEEVKNKALADLRKAIAAEKNLLCPTDDLFLLTFLRSRKYNVKKSFKLIQNYFKFRKEYSDIYNGLNVDRDMELLQRDFIGLLGHRDRNGCAVFISKFGLWDPDIDSYESVFRVASAILVFSQEHEATHVAGFRGIFDFRGITWKQLKYFTPSNFLMVIRSTQFCYPARYKGAHILCDNKGLNFLWTMLYPLLTPKLKKRIFFHGEDLTPLKQHIHPSVLPEEFGGEAPTFSNKSLMGLAHSRKDVVVGHLKYGYTD